MTKLSDTQRILLSTASQRDGGSLLPLPATLKPGGSVTKAITSLVTRGLAEERPTDDRAAISRVDGDLNYGVFITDGGTSAIGLKADPGAKLETTAASPPLASPPIKAATKTTLVVDLLGRAHGATLPELIAATGWLPHTTRAALTGIRKKGHAVERSKRDGATCYRIVTAA